MNFIEANVAIPENCFLHKLTKLHGRQIWKDERGCFYTWDRLHGHVEKFNRNRLHQGTYDAIIEGRLIDDPIPGRTIEI